MFRAAAIPADRIGRHPAVESPIVRIANARGRGRPPSRRDGHRFHGFPTGPHRAPRPTSRGGRPPERPPSRPPRPPPPPPLRRLRPPPSPPLSARGWSCEDSVFCGAPSPAGLRRRLRRFFLGAPSPSVLWFCAWSPGAGALVSSVMRIPGGASCAASDGGDPAMLDRMTGAVRAGGNTPRAPSDGACRPVLARPSAQGPQGSRDDGS